MKLPEKLVLRYELYGIIWKRSLSRRRAEVQEGVICLNPRWQKRFFFIQKLKDAGLSLKDIKAIYQTRSDGETGNTAYPVVLRLLERQKDLVEQKIADYQRLKTEIEASIELVKQCDGCQIKPSRQNCGCSA